MGEASGEPGRTGTGPVDGETRCICWKCWNNLPEQLATFLGGFSIDFVCGKTAER